MANISMLTPEQARSFMDANKPDSYVLLDVRQAWEYEEEHLPGARHLPLAELPDRMDEIDRSKPVLIYCASGGRSMAASTLVEGQGHPEVSNLVGGMGAWGGNTAFGPMDLGLIEFTGKETPEEIVLKAYAMEDDLQLFYVERADMAETLERIELFMELAGFEDKHKTTLFNLYCKLTGSDMDQDSFEKVACKKDTVVEGGITIERFFEEYPHAFGDEQGVLQLAVAVEAQALDYYLRCSDKAESQETREILQLLAREEKAHLRLLGKFMDKRDA